MSTKFRLCSKADLPAVQVFVDALYASDCNTLEVHADIALTFGELCARPEKGSIIVFESEDTEVIGYCIIIFFWSNEYGGDILEIDEVFVAVNHRRKGVSEELFAWLEDYFAKEKVGLALQVSEENMPALKLVEKQGFSLSRNRHLIRLLSKAPHRHNLEQQKDS